MVRYLIATILILGCVNLHCLANDNVKLAPTARLNNGYEMPVVGLGTYALRGDEGEKVMKDAIDVGYRHIDTAYLYGNEKEVGNAVRAKINEGVIKREDIFITTKIWDTFHAPDQVEKAFQKSFDNLNLDYIDLFLMHSPRSVQQVNKDGSANPPIDVEDVNLFPAGPGLDAKIDYVDTWKAMEKLLKTDRVRNIGISNFNAEQVERLYSAAEVKPVTNQVEFHPNLNQRKLVKFCSDRNITVTAYSPLGGQSPDADKPLAIRDPSVKEIADKYNKSPAQVILRYLIQRKAIVIPKTTKKDRLKANIELFDFVLNEQDLAVLDGFDKSS